MFLSQVTEIHSHFVMCRQEIKVLSGLNQRTGHLCTATTHQDWRTYSLSGLGRVPGGQLKVQLASLPSLVRVGRLVLGSSLVRSDLNAGSTL